SWALAAALALVALSLAAVHFSERPTEVYPVRFTVPPPGKVTFDWLDIPVVSPNGQRLAFTGMTPEGKRALWIRSMESLTNQPLPGTEDAAFPFWSPDGRFIGFFAEGKLKKIDVSGGPPQTLFDAPLGGGGSWNQDGIIVFNPVEGPLYRVSAAGGETKPLLELDKSRREVSHSWPSFLPDGRHFLYLARSADAGKTGIYLGSLDSKETRLLVNADSNAAYAPPGFLIFSRQEILLAQPFDVRKLQVIGEPFPIAESVGRMTFIPGAHFSVSENGVLAYRSGGTSNSQFAWYNRDGKRLGSVGEPGDYRQIVLSPDGKRLAIERPDPKVGTTDLWLLELESGIMSRLTFDPANDSDPVWSSDGRRLLFSSSRKKANDLYIKVIGGEEELLFESGEDKFAEEWSKDGSSILFISLNGKAFYRLPGPGGSPGERKPELLLRTEFDKDEPHISPDGRWIAYNSLESGRWEVYVASFPKFTEKRQVSNAGGCQPLWRKDGKELFYLGMDGKLMAVDVKAGAGFEAGAPKVLFQTPLRADPIQNQYDVTGDGQKFILGEPIEQEVKPIKVVLNWTAGLKR
ncbi:MAG: PD40 domain-containing protein, partial [Acidobacteria bacterium]|nr:PD40 domain-containing protein [Acidobacteriota bacterium]